MIILHADAPHTISNVCMRMRACAFFSVHMQCIEIYLVAAGVAARQDTVLNGVLTVAVTLDTGSIMLQ